MCVPVSCSSRAVRAAAPAANDRCRYLRHASLQLEWKRDGDVCATRAAWPRHGVAARIPTRPPCT
ncbi:hypothetical protein C7S16_3056 [Burkholderia thailandensis]|uniref:Uncharacterized protein n=1 Tax=Burkholderia thailandensis TaxID=57975 RepID=A0AAW9CXG3_BURTH|nr:hypothetical protein [Burkholderia thailandensis]MDW9255284.1 hypothetical protein [Burkholderia thailandensis]